MTVLTALRHQAQELAELGPTRTLYRIRRELQLWAGVGLAARPPTEVLEAVSARNAHRLALEAVTFERPAAVREVMAGRVPAERLRELEFAASEARKGRILAFGRWWASYGTPIDWHVNPTNGRAWNRHAFWSRALDDESRLGDVKLTWEIGRFPHAYHLARAATFDPERAEFHGKTLVDHILSFSSNSPFPYGVHWNSGQEIVIRYVAWGFSLAALDALGFDVKFGAAAMVRRLPMVAAHLKAHFDYVRHAVYNNHLVAEALGLYLVGRLFPDSPTAQSWQKEGVEEIIRQAAEQFAPDGAYIQNAHNYHRVALQYYLLAWRAFEHDGVAIPAPMRAALESSLDFLVKHQNPADGRLPNYGSNDGALPFVLSTCDFSDMRPTLQAVSVAVRGERIYEPGPWDEETAWLVGAKALDAPLRAPSRTSVHFDSGYIVLRAGSEDHFASFRCGNLRDRFSQIDMLVVDYWWKNHNVLIDGGSYLYNGPAVWHEHFMRTGSHNAVRIDGQDQMVHLRRFKSIYWTQAKVLDFRVGPGWAVCTGEHYGYQRLPGHPVHRRSVLVLGNDRLIVADTITGEGDHEARLHWLCEDVPYAVTPDGLRLDIPAGSLLVAVLDGEGRTQAIDVVRGDEQEPRGWSARYYGERTPTPSLTATQRGSSLTFITVVGPAAGFDAHRGYTLADGHLSPSETTP